MQPLLEEMLTAECSDFQARAEPWDSGSNRQMERKEVKCGCVGIKM